MKVLAGVVLGVLIVGCAAPLPSVGPLSTPTVTPPTPAQSSRPSESPVPALVADAFGDIAFVRPSTWQKIRPTLDVFPGPLLWLSSVPLDAACTRTTVTSE